MVKAGEAPSSLLVALSGSCNPGTLDSVWLWQSVLFVLEKPGWVCEEGRGREERSVTSPLSAVCPGERPQLAPRPAVWACTVRRAHLTACLAIQNEFAW